MLSKKYKKKARLRDDTPKRYDKTELHKRVQFIIEKEVCQVCEVSYDLDYPHHSVYGLGKKDDDSLVNICVDCHREIHSGSYSNLAKTREEIVAIGEQNNKEYLNSIDF